MRLGVLSDVHANLPALRATVDELRGRGVDGWLCAGDLVGYGPHPNECVELLAELGVDAVHGNHDLMLLGGLPEAGCGPDGREVLRWTATVLRADCRAFLAALPAEYHSPPLLMTHAALGDPECYVETPAQAAEQLDRLTRERPGARLLLVGHTHHPWVWGGTPGHTVLPVPPTDPIPLAGDAPFLVNPGSVGQSRRPEARPLTRSMLLDLDAGRVTPVAVPYDHRATRDALRRAGLPPDGAHQRRGVVPAARRRLHRLARRARRARPPTTGQGHTH